MKWQQFSCLVSNVCGADFGRDWFGVEAIYFLHIKSSPVAEFFFLKLNLNLKVFIKKKKKKLLEFLSWLQNLEPVMQYT